MRVRFLADIEDGIELTIHDSFENNVKALCGEHIGTDCPYCGDDSLRTRTAYFWPVWDQDAKEVKLFEGYPNNFNPLSALAGMYEAYGTLTDRDYTIGRNGTGMNTSYSVVPMDKVKFRNAKAKPFSEKEIMKILAAAYPIDDADSDDEDEAPKKKKKAPKKDEPKKKRKPDPEPEEDEDDDEEESEYAGLSAKELYKECKERDIECLPKKKAPYYIELLEADDAENDDEDDDDWEDEEEDEDDEDEW